MSLPQLHEFKKSKTPPPCVATIGSFDGVHRGHQFVISQVVCQAHKRRLDAVVVTFSNHPLQVLRNGFQPQMLTLTEEKQELLKRTAINRVEMMEFTRDLAQMSAYDFMRIILKERLQVKVLIVGYDNHFGHDRKGFADYRYYGEELGIEIMGCKELTSDHGVSSTEIRQALLQGDVETANHILGYSYFLQGKVVEGFQNGRKLGYPTANLQVDAHKLIPENGVYFVRCQLATDNQQLTTFHGMLNVGTRPTLHNGKQRSIEVHLFDFEGNLYGSSIRVELLHRLRGEREFDSLESLHSQLIEDEKACRDMKLTN